MKQIVGYVMVALAALQVLFSILTLSLNAWVEYRIDNKNYWSSLTVTTLGLWKICIGEKCDSIPDGLVDISLKIARGCVIVGMLLNVGVAASAAFQVFFVKTGRNLYSVMNGLFSLEGLCFLAAIGVFVYKGKFQQNPINLSKSDSSYERTFVGGFIMAIIEIVTSIILGIVMTMYKRMQYPAPVSGLA
ncbi:hypothetical protein DPMN_079898 [Dreissena polymorpha]|uniref:Uncharacterized protein n=1 Tax=Dreissena polymorpha TaxID=45954 RepID=A0A9D4BTD3_DREPO|nr:hypothetical protein DPMN_079898 [Dreissena polymorpha]